MGKKPKTQGRITPKLNDGLNFRLIVPIKVENQLDSIQDIDYISYILQPSRKPAFRNLTENPPTVPLAVVASHHKKYVCVRIPTLS